MRIFAVFIEPRMSAAKFATPRKGCNQAKILVEFVPDAATWRRDAFQHCESKAAMLNRGLNRLVVLEQCSVQIASWKQQAQSLLSDAHPVYLKLGPNLGGGATYPVRIKHHQCRLMIISIGGACRDYLPSFIATQTRHHQGKLTPTSP